jgi:sulfur carrier protein ThiS
MDPNPPAGILKMEQIYFLVREPETSSSSKNFLQGDTEGFFLTFALEYNLIVVEQAMKTVKLQVYSWISGTMGTADNQNQTVKSKIVPGMTVHDLFAGLAERYPEFLDQIYNPATGKFSDQVMVILNGRLVQAKEFRQAQLQDKDSLTLSPVLVGG